MTKVFVSHCSDDRSLVERDVVATLESRGLGTWYSRDEIRGADEWQESIRKGLRECDWFLVVLSQASVASQWVRAEVGLAFRQFPQGRIVPVIVEECEAAECHIQLPLLQYVDLRGDSALAKRRLLRAFHLGPVGGDELRDEASEVVVVSVVDRLRRMRDSADASDLAFVFTCLKDDADEVRQRALQTIRAIGWPALRSAANTLARQGDSAKLERLLAGLGVLQAHEEVVGLLDGIIHLLPSQLRDRAILLVEWKRLSLESESESRLFDQKQVPYEILRVLGQGLFASSFLARHRISGLEVVVRVPRLELTMNPRLHTAYMELLKQSMKYKHDNLVLCRDIGELTQGRFYTIRDYLDAPTLQDALNGGAHFTMGQIVELARHAVRGLEVVHADQRAHGSIKPTNIFWCSGGRFVLGDISLPVSHAIDMIVAHCSNPIPLLRKERKNVPRKLESIISRLLAKSPEDRVASARELIEALTPLSQGHNVGNLLKTSPEEYQQGLAASEASSDHLWKRASRWWRKNPNETD